MYNYLKRNKEKVFPKMRSGFIILVNLTSPIDYYILNLMLYFNKDALLFFVKLFLISKIISIFTVHFIQQVR